MARPKAVGYIRVSTTEQVSGFGLDIQEKAIREYCKANGLQLTDVFRDEGISGSNGLESRVGLAEALAKLKAGEASSLVVYRLDRLARDLILQETLVERLRDQGTPAKSASEPDLDTDTDDPTKVLIRQIVGVVSQYERAVIKGRMMSGKAAKAAQGGYLGGRVPYGFRLEQGQVVPDDAEQVVVALVGRLKAGGSSLREIAVQLQAQGFRPREGDHWHPNTIRRIAGYSPNPKGAPSNS
jgi:DNA invertase Pin-like site-specific DNA recombinase